MAEPANAVVWIEAMDSIVGLLVCECARDVGRCAKNLIICSIKSPMTFLTNFLFLKRDDIYLRDAICCRGEAETTAEASTERHHASLPL